MNTRVALLALVAALAFATAAEGEARRCGPGSSPHMHARGVPPPGGRGGAAGQQGARNASARRLLVELRARATAALPRAPGADAPPPHAPAPSPTARMLRGADQIITPTPFRPLQGPRVTTVRAAPHIPWMHAGSPTACLRVACKLHASCGLHAWVPVCPHACMHACMLWWGARLLCGAPLGCCCSTPSAVANRPRAPLPACRSPRRRSAPAAPRSPPPRPAPPPSTPLWAR